MIGVSKVKIEYPHILYKVGLNILTPLYPAANVGIEPTQPGSLVISDFKSGALPLCQLANIVQCGVFFDKELHETSLPAYAAKACSEELAAVIPKNEASFVFAFAFTFLLDLRSSPTDS